MRNISLQEAVTQKKADFCLAEKDGSPRLKRTHAYFYQIQATMYCTGRQWCDFVVRTTVSLHIERVSFDTDFWKSAMLRLRTFFFSTSERREREPSDWLDKESLNQKTERFVETL